MRTHLHASAHCIYFRVFRTGIGLWVYSPCHPARLPHAVPVRWASALPAVSFGFHLAMSTRAVRLTVPPVRPTHGPDAYLQGWQFLDNTDRVGEAVQKEVLLADGAVSNSPVRTWTVSLFSTALTRPSTAGAPWRRPRAQRCSRRERRDEAPMRTRHCYPFPT